MCTLVSSVDLVLRIGQTNINLSTATFTVTSIHPTPTNRPIGELPWPYRVTVERVRTRRGTRERAEAAILQRRGARPAARTREPAASSIAHAGRPGGPRPYVRLTRSGKVSRSTWISIVRRVGAGAARCLRTPGRRPCPVPSAVAARMQRRRRVLLTTGVRSADPTRKCKRINLRIYLYVNRNLSISASWFDLSQRFKWLVYNKSIYRSN